MRIVVFGASGGCGRLVVGRGLEKGHDITAVVRPQSVEAVPDGARIVVGDVLDADFVGEAVSGHGAVVSCLGLRRAALFPWARLLSPPDLVTAFTGHLVRAPAARTVERIVWISAGGVGDSRQRCSAPIRAMIRAGNVGVAYEDLERAERLVPPNDPRWVAARPVTLVNGPATGSARRVARYGLFSIVRRADLAHWMVGVAEGTVSAEGSTVLLASRPG